MIELFEIIRGLGNDQALMVLAAVFGTGMTVVGLKSRNVESVEPATVFSTVAIGVFAVGLSFVLTLIAGQEFGYIIVAVILSAVIAGV